MTLQEKKKYIFLTLSFVMIGVVAIYGLNLLKVREPVQKQLMLKYKNFEAKDPVLDFTFEYPPSGWDPVESQGRIEKCDLVYLRGPVDEKTKFTTLIHITVRPAVAGKAASDLLRDYLKIDSDLSHFKASRENTLSVGGEGAKSAFCEYEAIPSYDVRVPAVAFKKQMVFIVKNGRSYEFTLNTFESQFNAYAPVLEHVLKTFKFKK